MSGHKGKPNTFPKTNNLPQPGINADPEVINLVAPIRKNTIWVNIGGRKTHGLIDTGAGISCISKTFLDKTDFKNSTFQNCTLKEIIGVGGERHRILGKVDIPIAVSGFKISYHFYVLDSLHHSLILGIDFLKHHKVQIDLEAGKVHIKDKVFSASLITTKAGFARVAKSTCVPAVSEIELEVKVSRRKKWGSCAFRTYFKFANSMRKWC